MKHSVKIALHYLRDDCIDRRRTKKNNASSPDGNIVFSFRLVNKTMEYSVALKENNY